MVDPSGETAGHSPAKPTSPALATSGALPGPPLVICMSVRAPGLMERKNKPEPSGLHAGSSPVTSPELYSIFPGLSEPTPSSDITSMRGGASGEAAAS
jgi:hypothetical protein